MVELDDAVQVAAESQLRKGPLLFQRHCGLDWVAERDIWHPVLKVLVRYK